MSQLIQRFDRVSCRPTVYMYKLLLSVCSCTFLGQKLKDIEISQFELNFRLHCVNYCDNVVLLCLIIS